MSTNMNMTSSPMPNLFYPGMNMNMMWYYQNQGNMWGETTIANKTKQIKAEYNIFLLIFIDIYTYNIIFLKLNIKMFLTLILFKRRRCLCLYFCVALFIYLISFILFYFI